MTKNTFFFNYYINSNINLFLFTFFILLAVCCLLVAISYYISKPYANQYTEKAVGFECGFNPFSNIKKPFNIKFFLISILFLIFDVELIFIFPWMMYYTTLSLFSYLYIFFFFLFLLIGFYYEFKSNCLDLK